MNPESSALEIGKNRIEALGDAIFAIAMTLLVLEFHVPDLPPNAPNVEVAPALFKLWPKFFAYAVSFIGLGVYWIGHHNMYHAIRRSDRVLLGLNILFFMFAAFLPFSTSVLNAFRQTQVAPLFFAANLTIIGWILYLQWAYVSSQPDMLATFVSTEYRQGVRFRFLMIPIVATLTMLICFWSVEVTLAVYAFLLPFYMIPERFDRGPTRAAVPLLKKDPSTEAHPE